MRKKHPFEDILETQVKREIGLKSTFRYRQKKTLRIGDLISKPLLSKNENYTNPTSSAIARNRYRLSPKLEVFGLVVLHQVLYVRVAWRSGIGKYSYKWWGCSIAMLVSRSSNLSNTVSTETYLAKIICHQSSQPNSKMMNHDNIKPLKSANFPYKKPLPPSLQTPRQWRYFLHLPDLPTSAPRFPSPVAVVAAVPLASRSAAEFGGGGGGGGGGYIYGGFPKMVGFPNNFHGVFHFSY